MFLATARGSRPDVNYMDYPPKSSHGPAPARCRVEGGGGGGGGAEVDAKEEPLQIQTLG